MHLKAPAAATGTVTSASAPLQETPHILAVFALKEQNPVCVLCFKSSDPAADKLKCNVTALTN